MTEFCERLRAAMWEKHVRAVDLAKDTGITPQLVSHYLKGTYKPRQDRLDALARCLGVSPAWLMGLTDSPERLRPEEPQQLAPAYIPFTLSAHEKTLIEAYRTLDAKTRGIVDFIALGEEESEK